VFSLGNSSTGGTLAFLTLQQAEYGTGTFVSAWKYWLARVSFIEVLVRRTGLYRHTLSTGYLIHFHELQSSFGRI